MCNFQVFLLILLKLHKPNGANAHLHFHTPALAPTAFIEVLNKLKLLFKYKQKLSLIIKIPKAKTKEKHMIMT